MTTKKKGNITLPELRWFPARYNVGYAEQLLVPKRVDSVERTEDKKISARTTENFLVLSSGEHIIFTKRKGNITNRKITAIPDEVSGALRENPDGNWSGYSIASCRKPVPRSLRVA